MSGRCDHYFGAHSETLTCEEAQREMEKLGHSLGSKIELRVRMPKGEDADLGDEPLWEMQYQTQPNTVPDLPHVLTAAAFEEAYQKMKRHRLAMDYGMSPLRYAQIMEEGEAARSAAETIDRLMLDKFAGAEPPEPNFDDFTEDDNDPENPWIYSDGKEINFPLLQAVSAYARQFYDPIREGETIEGWWARVEIGRTRQGKAFTDLLRAVVVAATGVDDDELDAIIRRAVQTPRAPQNPMAAPMAASAPKRVPKFMQCCGNLPSSGHHPTCPTPNAPLTLAPIHAGIGGCGWPHDPSLPCPMTSPALQPAPSPVPKHLRVTTGHTCSPLSPMIDPNCVPCNPPPPLMHSRPLVYDPAITGSSPAKRGWVKTGDAKDPKESLLNPPVKGFIGSDKYGYDPDVD